MADKCPEEVEEGPILAKLREKARQYTNDLCVPVKDTTCKNIDPYIASGIMGEVTQEKPSELSEKAVNINATTSSTFENTSTAMTSEGIVKVELASENIDDQQHSAAPVQTAVNPNARINPRVHFTPRKFRNRPGRFRRMTSAPQFYQPAPQFYQTAQQFYDPAQRLYHPSQELRQLYQPRWQPTNGQPYLEYIYQQAYAQAYYRFLFGGVPLQKFNLNPNLRHDAV